MQCVRKAEITCPVSFLSNQAIDKLDVLGCFLFLFLFFAPFNGILTLYEQFPLTRRKPRALMWWLVGAANKVVDCQTFHFLSNPLPLGKRK